MLRAGLLALALAHQAVPQGQDPIVFEIRVFDGAAEVTSETRLTIYLAGERSQPAVRLHAAPKIETPVPPGIYDVQAIREVDGNVVSIRWAERLVVMPYPDEGGRHLQVVNFKNGYGALQVRGKSAGAPPDVAIFAPGVRDKEAAPAVAGAGYALFVVPAGKYDVRVRAKDRLAWHTDMEVPLNGTRLWIVP